MAAVTHVRLSCAVAVVVTMVGRPVFGLPRVLSVSSTPSSVRQRSVSHLASTDRPRLRPALRAAQPPQVRIARPEVVRGRVVTDSGSPVVGARVIVTAGVALLVREATADADGRWALHFADGPGDYLVYATAPGRRAARRRLTRGMPGLPGVGSADSVFTVDLALPAAVARLAAVQAQVRRPEPERRIPPNNPSDPGVGAAERDVDVVPGAVPPDVAGDLATVAATTPGILAGPGGVSALGLGPTQTNVTLGGLAFPGGSLPRDARTTTRVTTTTYDPARGWFGGAQIAAELVPGLPFDFRRAHLTADAPGLQVTDAAGRRLGQQFGSVQASAGADGPTPNDRWLYNVSGQMSRRVQPTVSLFDAAPEALAAAGVAPDSAARLAALLARAGVPVDLNARGQARIGDAFSFAGRVDRPFSNPRTRETNRRTYGATAFGSWRRDAVVGVGPTTTVSAGGHQVVGVGGVQGVYSTYLGRRNYLLDLRSGLSAGTDTRTPFDAGSRGIVLVGAASDADASSALVPITFGGNGLRAGRRRTALWENVGELRLYPPTRRGRSATRHRVTLTGDVRLDDSREEPAVDRFGTFTYTSLDALAAASPATYARTLSVPVRTARVWNGYLAAGDYMRVSDRLQLMYGVRAEATQYGTRPTANRDLERTLGVRTDVVPNIVGVSPRFGFTWAPGAVRRLGFTQSPIGLFRPPTSGVLRGGIGEFRNLLRPDLVADAAAATGVLGTTREIVCVGDAVPVPVWAAGQVGPASCVGNRGGGTNTLADTAPGVLAVDRRFRAPRSWRANLAWSGLRGPVVYSVEGVVALNRDQPGRTDANFAGVPQFATVTEGRAVFVPAAGIVPTTGALSPVFARRTDMYAQVAVQHSELRSVGRQFTVTLAPSRINTRWYGTAAYTLGSVRALQSGFDGSAFDDPRTREWARGDLDVRHQVLLQGGLTRGGLTATLFGRVESGRPFTPRVGSDVNGDGLVNDRAFVFSSATAARNGDAVLATGMRALLAGAPGYARRCLVRALDRPVSRNACEGPWTAALNAQLSVDGQRLRLGQRVRLGLNLSNPLGGLDQLFHGERLRGWGGPALLDPVLYQVRGFDRTRSAGPQFQYAVNPRFGDARPSATALRTPFRLTLDVRLTLNQPIGVQQVDKWLRPGRGGAGTRLTADELRRRYAETVPDPYGEVLEATDSLLLTQQQVAALEAAQARHRTRVDSIWAPLVTYLAALGDRYSAADAFRRQEAATNAVWEAARVDVRAVLPTVLSPAQQRAAPWPVSVLLASAQPVTLRIFSR